MAPPDSYTLLQADLRPAETLGNMRDNGVRRLDVSCCICHHAAVLDVHADADDVPVPWFGPRMVCTGDEFSKRAYRSAIR